MVGVLQVGLLFTFASQAPGPSFTTGPVPHTTQPPAAHTTFTTGAGPGVPRAPSFTTGGIPTTTGAPALTSGSSPAFTSGSTPGPTTGAIPLTPPTSPGFTTGPVSLTTGAFADPVYLPYPLAKRGIQVGDVFIPLPDTPPPPGPPRDAYVPLAEADLTRLGNELDALRTRVFEFDGEERAALMQRVRELQSVVMNARLRLGTLRTVVEESWPDARAEMDVIRDYVQTGIDEVETALVG